MVDEAPRVVGNPRRKRWEQFRKAWRFYGGWRALLKSSYFWTAVVLMLPTAHMWLRESWWELPLSILPSLLGFSLGGYAILLTFGDDRFMEFLARRRRNQPSAVQSATDQIGGSATQSQSASAEPSQGEPKPTLWMKVSATFLHFILVQLWAVIGAVIGKSVNFDPHEVFPSVVLRSGAIMTVVTVVSWVGPFIGFFLFLYALLLAGAAARDVFTMSDWFDRHLQDRK